jgi:hypothetical protein
LSKTIARGPSSLLYEWELIVSRLDLHRNPIWIAFFALVVLIALFFLFKAGAGVVSYYSYSKSAEAVIKKIEVVEQDPGKFILWARYSFVHEGSEIEGEGLVGGPYYNKFVAEQKASKLDGVSLRVWFKPKNPQIATFSRVFPIKQLISAAVLVLIAVYFFILGKYVGKRRNHT